MSSAEPHVLSIDLGTSGPKTVLVSLSGAVAGVGRSHVATRRVEREGAEQDAHQVWQAVKDSIGAALREAQVPARQIVAVICTSQYSSIVPVDVQGQPLAPMLTWMDHRGERSRLKGRPGFPRLADAPWKLANWVRLHGLAPVAAGMSLTHMRWFKYARPEVYARTFKFLEPGEYLGMRLCGRAATTQGTGYMSLLIDNRDLQASDYHPTLLSYGLIDRDKLADVVAPDTLLGPLLPEVAAELGLLPTTQVVAAMNDTQAGAMAAGVSGGRHAGISMGTTSILVSQSARKRTSLGDSLFTMPSPDRRGYLAVAENGTSGQAIDKFLHNLVLPADAFAAPEEGLAIDAYAALESALQHVRPGAEGVMYLPWINGSIAPRSESLMRGGFLNLGAETTRCHLARAVVEGIAMNARWAQVAMKKFVGQAYPHLRFYGGGARSDAIAHTLADVLGRPVRQLANPQYATSLGSSLIAFERLGLLGRDEFEARLPVQRCFEPRSEWQALYDDRFDQFTRAFKATRPLCRAMNRPMETTP
jgi:xylulokinase